MNSQALRIFFKAEKTAYHQLILRPLSTGNNYTVDAGGKDYFFPQALASSDRESTPVDLELFSHMQKHGSSLSTPYLLNKSISFCAKSGIFNVGIQFHSSVIKMGFLSNVYICSALVDLYGKHGEIRNAQRMFDEMPDKNVVSWNSLISAYLNVRCPEIALKLFVEMLKGDVAPTPFTVSDSLVGCSQLEAGEFGVQLHGLSMKLGLCHNLVVGTGLVDMYSKCWNVHDSRRVFNEMPEKNAITWTSMLGGYAHNEIPGEAMVLFRKMLCLGVPSNYVTYNSLLSSFSSPNDSDHCKQIHCHVIREGFISNGYIAVTLVIVYTRCGCSLKDLRKLCLGLSMSDQISWNAVIAGFSNLGHRDETLRSFTEMRQAGIDTDAFTFTSVLGVLGMSSAYEEGTQIHALTLKTGYAINLCVQNGLVSVYARCGAIKESRRVFVSIGTQDVVSWNSLLFGCAHHGYGREAIELFEEMRRTKIKPDGTTLLAVLSACSHAGSVDKGLEYFNLMRNGGFPEPPRGEHYAAVVDMLGRAGCLNEAETFVRSMELEPQPSIYKSLLSASQVHGNHEISLRSAKKLLELWPDDPATYIMVSNVFTTQGYWSEASGMRKLMHDRKVRKTPGHSWI